MQWNRDFRESECFQHLNQFVATGMKPEPHLFELFPAAKGRLLSFATAHLSEFSLEKVRDYFTTRLFPDLLCEFNEKQERSEVEDSHMPLHSKP